MATNLNPVDVVMIGLGAANGVAVLPLTRAGIKVTALEAGSWMKPGDFRADEIHNNVRRKVTTGRKVWDEIPTFRTSPTETARQGAAPTMMNAVGGTSIHWYECDSQGEHGSGLAAQLRRTGAVLRHH
jgi:choline dehydrogenase-like flavoprotein